jgi:GPH family glycoside/pentoside/hexuronide:cation symporter
MKPKLSFLTKLIYGSGDWGLSSSGMMRSVFYAIYLTDVVGLDPRLASVAALVGILWDAINDPLVGRLSDRMRTRWGRRRPFLLFFALPFGLSFVLLWSAPAWHNQIALAVYITLAFMLADTFSTLVSIPYLSLTPELAEDYDSRTSLAGFRSFFQLGASLAVVVSAPLIVDAMLERGHTQQQGFMLVAVIFGLMGTLSFVLIFLRVRESPRSQPVETLPISQTLRLAWSNIPFRFVVGIHLLNWSVMDMVAVIMPYFLLYWISGGDMLAKVRVFGLPLATESAFFGLLMLACILCLPFWLWLARRTSKPAAYLAGMTLFLVMELLLYLIRPGQTGLVLALAVLAGAGVSTAYILPDSIFPDMLEWDELRSGRRQEGIFYGARAFIRKLSGALTIFLALQFLGWAGYQAPPAGATSFQQPDRVLTAIRLLVSPIGAALILAALALAGLYPLTRERHDRIRRLLARRRAAQTLRAGTSDSSPER